MIDERFSEQSHDSLDATKVLVDLDYHSQMVRIMKTHHTCSTELLSELVLCLSILMDDDKQPLQIISDSDLMICFVEILTKDYEPTWGYKLKVYLITVLGKIAASSIVNRDELLKSFFIYDHILSQLESLQIH